MLTTRSLMTAKDVGQFWDHRSSLDVSRLLPRMMSRFAQPEGPDVKWLFPSIGLLTITTPPLINSVPMTSTRRRRSTSHGTLAGLPYVCEASGRGINEEGWGKTSGSIVHSSIALTGAAPSAAIPPTSDKGKEALTSDFLRPASLPQIPTAAPRSGGLKRSQAWEGGVSEELGMAFFPPRQFLSSQPLSVEDKREVHSVHDHLCKALGFSQAYLHLHGYFVRSTGEVRRLKMDLELAEEKAKRLEEEKRQAEEAVGRSEEVARRAQEERGRAEEELNRS
ncbi:hypothetical protein K1719_008991 [Acacia pycnantha]|nr:hypothetical protein K1719_008991 [Acacia pycnantha]